MSLFLFEPSGERKRNNIESIVCDRQCLCCMCCCTLNASTTLTVNYVRIAVFCDIPISLTLLLHTAIGVLVELVVDDEEDDDDDDTLLHMVVSNME